MVEVNLWSAMRRHTDGASKVEVDARNVGEMLAALTRQYPGLGPMIEAGVTVAVDGEISVDDYTVKLTPESEVYLLQRVRGG